LYTRGKRCVEHVANRGERCVQVLVGKVDAKDYLKDLGVDGWIILKWFFKEWGGDVE